MPAETKTRAIVLNSLPYGESDLIVSFLTEGHGLVKGMAKGARKSRRRFAGSFEPFTLVALRYAVKGSGALVRVDSADVLDARMGIREGLDRITAGARMAEVAALFESPGPGAGEAFGLLDTALKLLGSQPDPRGLSAVFVVKMLSLAGFKVPHEACGRCGINLKTRAAIYEGYDLLCPRCGGAGDGLLISPGGLAFIRQAEVMEPLKMGRLRLPARTGKEVFDFLREFVESATGKRLKTLDIRNDFC